MNLLIIIKILSFVVGLEGISFLLPALTGLIYKEYSGALCYLICSLCCITFCVLILTILKKKRIKRDGFFGKDAFVVTALSWVILSLIGAIPYVITGDIPNYIDAVFETASGFTTTGASVITDVESVMHCNLLFRSLTHWMGGVGVLVFILMIMPMAGGSPLSIMKAESTGPSISKLVPRAKDTALILYGLYIALTVLEFVLLLFDPSIPVFDNICHTFGTAGTGGFSVRNVSVAAYSPYVQTVTTVFMLLFGVNFSFYYLLLARKFKEAFRMEEIKWYFAIYLGAVVMMLGCLASTGYNFAKNILNVSFTCASLMTTTGYTIVDFGDWPTFTHCIFVVLMFVGGCAGSTGGGFKIARVMLIVKQIGKEIRQQIHPNRVYHIRVDRKPVSGDVLKSCNTLFIADVAVMAVSVLLVALDGFDLTTSFAAVHATLNNIGMGIGNVCVGDNFSVFSPLSKLVMTFDMLAGRLEIIPMLILFHPQTWKK